MNEPEDLWQPLEEEKGTHKWALEQKRVTLRYGKSSADFRSSSRRFLGDDFDADSDKEMLIRTKTEVASDEEDYELNKDCKRLFFW